MSRRFPPKPLSPLSRRRRRRLQQVHANSKISPARPKKTKIGQPWITNKSVVQIPQLTLKPHERPKPPPSPLTSRRIRARSTNQKQSTLRAVQRWKARKTFRSTRNVSDTHVDCIGKSCKASTSSISNEMALFLCNVSGTMIKEFRKFDEDFSGELSKPEFEDLMEDLRKKDTFKLSRQDADLLFLAFDEDQSGSITTREVVEGLFKCHHKCPTNILGQRLLPRKVREHHDEKHGLQAPIGYSHEKQCASPRQSVFAPLNFYGNSALPLEYSSLPPAVPTLSQYQVSPSMRRQHFMYTSNII